MTQSEISPDVLRHNLKQYFRFCVYGSSYYFKLAKENEDNKELSERYWEEGSKYLDKATETRAFLKETNKYPEQTEEEIEESLSKVVLDQIPTFSNSGECC